MTKALANKLCFDISFTVEVLFMLHPLQQTSVFAGRYRILRKIAAGSMGAVYEVVHLETHRRRALKVMHPQTLDSEELRERFKLEAKIAAHIESKYIVDVFDAGIETASGMPFLVMELLQGEELGKRLKRVGRFSPAEVLTFLHQTALALDKTHRAGVVHRDLKPGNLFLVQRDDDTPYVKVLDFGVAKVLAEGTISAGTATLVGTPLYMAPEQFQNRKISPSVDIYALGMMAYTLLVGKAYWSEEMRPGGNVVAFAMTVCGGIRESASVRAARHGAVLPRGFDAWFSVATASDPELRFTSALAAVSALADALGLPLSPVLSSASLSPSIVGSLLSTSIAGPPLVAPSPSTSIEPPLASGMDIAPASTQAGAAMSYRPSEFPKRPIPSLFLVFGGALLASFVFGLVFIAMGVAPAQGGSSVKEGESAHVAAKPPASTEGTIVPSIALQPSSSVTVMPAAAPSLSTSVAPKPQVAKKALPPQQPTPPKPALPQPESIYRRD